MGDWSQIVEIKGLAGVLLEDSEIIRLSDGSL